MNAKDNMSAVNEITNKGIERMTSLGELNLKVVEKMAARQMDAMNLFMEQGVRMMRLAGEAKGYGDFYKGQIDMAKEMTERMMTESKSNMQFAAEVRDDYRTWFDGMMADVRNSSEVVRGTVSA